MKLTLVLRFVFESKGILIVPHVNVQNNFYGKVGKKSMYIFKTRTGGLDMLLMSFIDYVALGVKALL